MSRFFSYHLYNSSLQRSSRRGGRLRCCRNRCHVQSLQVRRRLKGGWPGDGAEGFLKWVTVLLRAKRKRLRADQHTRYTGNTHGPCRHTRQNPFRVRGAEWIGVNGAASRPHWRNRWSPSGARGSTRQHTVNPKTAPVLPSRCVGILPLPVCESLKGPVGKRQFKINNCDVAIVTVKTILRG